MYNNTNNPTLTKEAQTKEISQLEEELLVSQTLSISFAQALNVVIKKLELMSAETHAEGDMVRDYEKKDPYYEYAHKYQHIADELQRIFNGVIDANYELPVDGFENSNDL